MLWSGVFCLKSSSIKPDGIWSNESRQIRVNSLIQKETSTRPFEIDSLQAEFSCHRIPVNVFHRRCDRLRREQVAIETGALLPESKTMLPRTFSDSQLFEQSCGAGLEQLPATAKALAEPVAHSDTRKRKRWCPTGSVTRFRCRMRITLRWTITTLHGSTIRTPKKWHTLWRSKSPQRRKWGAGRGTG